MSSVRRPEDANGLVAILGDLLDQNLERDPGRADLCRRGGSVSLRAADIGLAATLHLDADGVTLADGFDKTAQIRVRADSMTLLELSAVPLRLGFPDPFTSDGRAILKRLRTKELRVKGLVRHPGLLSRLNRLLSVAA